MSNPRHVPRNWQTAPHLSLAEAAAVLGVSKSKAYEMADAGDLPTHLDEHRRHRVKPGDLEPFLTTRMDQVDLFSPEDVVAGIAHWLASVADSDGVIRDAEAIAMIQEALNDE